jgi:Protein of unknown function (DUF2924)
VIAMRSNAKSLARRPKDISAADLNDRAVARSDGLDPPGSQSPSKGANAEGGATANAPDGASPLSDRIAVLGGLSLADLRLEWRRLFRAEPPRLSRDIMMRAIAYRLQEIAHGGPSKVTRRRLMTLAAEFETSGQIAPPPGPKLKPGSRLVREWHGRTHTVSVTDDGFEFQGKTYRSLTKIAFDITGAQWSGPRFFGLTKTSAAAVTPDDVSNGAQTISGRSNG